MEIVTSSVGSSAGRANPTEGRMLREDVVKEILASVARGRAVKHIAREQGVDRKTVKAWRRRGPLAATAHGEAPAAPGGLAAFIGKRAPEVTAPP